MNTQQIFAIVLMVVGVAMFVIGLNATDSVADRFSNFFTGHFTDTTVWYLIGGITCAVGGLMVWMFGGRTDRA